MSADSAITETSPALLEALAAATGRESFVEHTGGGVMVAVVNLGGGKQVWLTREEKWIVGFYDFTADVEDEGICLELLVFGDDNDDPEKVAAAVAGILRRVGAIPAQSIHTFASSREAYDASQCRSEIRDGDVLVALNENAVAVMVSAWPTAIDDGHAGLAFHKLAFGVAWDAVPNLDGDTTDYSASAAVAREVAASEDDTLRLPALGWPIRHHAEGRP